MPAGPALSEGDRRIDLCGGRLWILDDLYLRPVRCLDEDVLERGLTPEVVIASFGDNATSDFFHGVPSKGARQWQSIEDVAHGKLDMVNAAAKLYDLEVPPGNRLEALKGHLVGHSSVRINQQWRVVFKWKDGGAHAVRIADYH
jgi:proteic killer suppression protein